MYEQQQKNLDKKIDQLIKTLVQNSKQYEQSQILLHTNLSILPQVLQRAKTILEQQPALLDLNPPMKIVGSIYGHFKNMVKLLQFTGWPSQSSYLFLGNYVDYGPSSLQTMILLLLFKVKHPTTFFLLRGSHECAYMNTIHGFYQECKSKQHIKTWESICQIYQQLPYAAVIGNRIFCVSGGIGPTLHDVRQVQKLQRGTQFVDEGLAADLIWSDPDQLQQSFSKNIQGYGVNYGNEAVKMFLKNNSLELICRSRQVVEKGFNLMFSSKLMNIFSTCNFKNKYHNSAAVLAVSSQLFCQVLVYKPKKHQTAIADIIN